MNQKQQSVILAGLLAFALAGCSSTKGSGDDMGAGATASGGASAAMRGTDSTTPGMAATGAGSMPTQAQAPTPTPAPADMAAMPAGAPNAVVMLIEPMPKSGSAAVGGSGTSGTTGSSMGEDNAYRITLRMDDGTTRVVTQEKAPTYRQGDRVNMQDGVISH